MNYLYSDDPIIACSTGGQSNTAIAVIRLSGFKSLIDLEEFIDIDTTKIKTRYAHFCKILDGTEIVDEIVLTYFKGPNSYNGENILELSVHGNIFNIERIIKLFTSNNIFRIANPGEFTYRALKNKKLSLSQVEGLDLLLNASSPFSLKQGFSLLSGKLQDSYNSLYKSFLNHKSSVELSIDFLEDIGEEESDRQFHDSLRKLKKSVETLKKRVSTDSLNLISPDITLVGLPNAGKSSLFNKLLLEDRAIVSDVAGTTRDFITEKIRIGDTHFNLIDTAGVRESNDKIESEGIKRALGLIKKSFYKVLVINPFEFDITFFQQLYNINFDLVLFTHSDRDGFSAKTAQIKSDLKDILLINGPIEPSLSGPIGAEENGPIEPKLSGPIGAKENGPIEPKLSGPIGAKKNGPIEPKTSGPIGAKESGSIEPICVDSIVANLTEDSEELIKYIEFNINKKYLEVSSREPIIIERHIDVIDKIYIQLSNYSNLSSFESDISILSSELNIVGHCISELIGIVSPDDVLHNIFDNFCIGK